MAKGGLVIQPLDQLTKKILWCGLGSLFVLLLTAFQAQACTKSVTQGHSQGPSQAKISPLPKSAEPLLFKTDPQSLHELFSCERLPQQVYHDSAVSWRLGMAGGLVPHCLVHSYETWHKVDCGEETIYYGNSEYNVISFAAYAWLLALIGYLGYRMRKTKVPDPVI